MVEYMYGMVWFEYVWEGCLVPRFFILVLLARIVCSVLQPTTSIYSEGELVIILSANAM